MRVASCVVGFCLSFCLAPTASAQVHSVGDPSAFHPYHTQDQAKPPSPPIATTTAARPARPEGLTDETIIALVRAGLGPETVVAKINATPGTYDTSTDALIRLKQAGVPDPVIAAMLKRSSSPVLAGAAADNINPDPMVPHSPGIYMLDQRGSGRMVRIDPTVSNQTKTSNIWGYAFTYGLSSAKLKTVIPNASARVQAASRRPVFYFYFNQTGPLASLADFSMSFAATTTTPSEFSLVHFDQKRDHREAAVMSIGLGSVKTGVSDKARIAFTYEDVAPGVFRVSPSTDLLPGEYGFIASMGAGTGMIARIFDFSVS
jgi:hypothetical protein